MKNNVYEAMIDSGDITIFNAIRSSTSAEDRSALLALQRAVRGSSESYCYLEIGSQLGGSLQPYVLDPRCSHIYSIDPRPLVQPDERGRDDVYEDNSTQRMIENLERLPSADVNKLTCFELDARHVDPKNVKPRPSLCFIDGEHTHKAAISDFAFCINVVDENGAVAFHDFPVIFSAIDAIIARLLDEKRIFRAYLLASDVFVIEFGNCAIHEDQHVRALLSNNYKGCVRAMMHLNDRVGFYKAFYDRRICKILRRIRHPLR